MTHLTYRTSYIILIQFFSIAIFSIYIYISSHKILYKFQFLFKAVGPTLSVSDRSVLSLWSNILLYYAYRVRKFFPN